MRLRTTPPRLGLRDVELFPGLERSRLRCGSPYLFIVTMSQGCVLFNIDGFHVPPEIEDYLTKLYAHYHRWWLYDSDLRKPRGRVTHSIFNGCAGITVHRDHAEGWVRLFNNVSAFTYNPSQFPYTESRYSEYLDSVPCG